MSGGRTRLRYTVNHTFLHTNYLRNLLNEPFICEKAFSLREYSRHLPLFLKIIRPASVSTFKWCDKVGCAISSLERNSQPEYDRSFKSKSIFNRLASESALKISSLIMQKRFSWAVNFFFSCIINHSENFHMINILYIYVSAYVNVFLWFFSWFFFI